MKKFAESENMTYQRKLSLFHSFDKNGNGQLSKKEFGAFLKAAGMNASPLEIDLIFMKFDTDKNNSISMAEFEVFINEEMKRLGPEFYRERVITPKANASFNKTGTARPSSATAPAKPLSKSATVSAAPTPKERTRPSSAKPLSKTAPAPISRGQVGNSLGRNDNKLVNSIKGRNPSLVSKSLEVPTKKAVLSSRQPSAVSESVDLSGIDTSLRVSRETVASAKQASAVVDMLQTQAEIESQLGSKYYQ